MVRFSPLLAFCGLCLSLSLRASALTIMPLGDSITAGYNGNPGQSSYPGYRLPLLGALTADGIQTQYVGAYTGNLTPQLSSAGENASNGYSGYNSLDILGNLDANVTPRSSNTPNEGGYWLTGGGGTGRSAVYPDVVLLMIGTNDSGQGIPIGSATTPHSTLGDIAGIINWFSANRPATKVIVSSQILSSGQPWINSYAYAEEAWLPGFLAANAPGDKYVDLTAAVPLSDISADGVHPSDAGYAIISSDFAAAIQSMLPTPLTGDANRDGRIDGSDYSQIDNGYMNHLTGWGNGDFNGDGVVDGSDYTLIDTAFNMQGAGTGAVLATGQIATAIPEPALPVLAVVAGFGALRRRRRIGRTSHHFRRFVTPSRTRLIRTAVSLMPSFFAACSIGSVVTT